MARDKLTRKQEGYAQDRASGLAQSAAYRNYYGTSTMSAKTVWEAASRLDTNYKVSARILELQSAVEAALAVKRLWTLDRLVDEAESNLEGARAANQWGSANGAIEWIGRATGLVSDKQPVGGSVAVTKIIINLAPGVKPPTEVVEAAEYRELPRPRPDLAEGTQELPQDVQGSMLSQPL